MADEVKGKGQREEVGRSSAPRRRVTSQMLLNKFQRDHERQQHREEEARREKEHWRCPFFVYCWEEGLMLPSTYDCPECNGQGSQQQQQQQHSLFSQASWGRLEMKPERNKFKVQAH